MPRTIAALVLAALLYGCVPAPPAPDMAPGPPALLCVMPGQQPPRLVVLALHGLRGSAGVFAQPARAWSQQGIVTYAITLSYPDAAPDDVHALIRAVRARHPGLPLVVLGESLGASLAVSALARPDAPKVDALVLSAPAIWPDAISGSLARRGLSLVSPFWSKVVAVMEGAREDAARLHSVHALILAGGRDEVVPRSGIDLLVKRLDGAEFMVFPEGGHTLFRNPGGEAVTAQVAAWMLTTATKI